MTRPKWFDPFIFALLTVVALATLLPAQGPFARIVSVAADAGIVVLFFLHGARLSRKDILAGAGNWRLHLLVLGTTFLLFPMLGLGLSMLPLLSPAIATGLLFLSLLPSTVQSSIAFTSIAGGNVPAAICAATLSNLIGMGLTPLLVVLLMKGGAGLPVFSLSSVQTIVLQLLLPFVVGHLARPWVGDWVSAHKRAVSLTDRGSILLVVYSAFGSAVSNGLWNRFPASQIALTFACCAALLLLVLVFTWLVGRALGLQRADAIVLQFCGSKKSLTTGVPIASVLFPAAAVGMIIFPLMMFHQMQLIACAVLARRYANDGSQADPAVRDRSGGKRA